MTARINTSSPSALRAYVMGGKARFTIVNPRTGTRFTYRVVTSDDKPAFVSVLTGPDNDANYTYVGHVLTRIGRYVHGKRSRIAEDAPSAVAARWFLSAVLAGRTLPPALEVWHDGRCARCGRSLTVPESIACGFGPECATHVGADVIAALAGRTTVDGASVGKAA